MLWKVIPNDGLVWLVSIRITTIAKSFALSYFEVVKRRDETRGEITKKRWQPNRGSSLEVKTRKSRPGKADKIDQTEEKNANKGIKGKLKTKETGENRVDRRQIKEKRKKKEERAKQKKRWR